MKYFDVHIKTYGDSKEGYSIFLELPDYANNSNAIQEIIDKKLYEEKEDIYNIDWVGEISKNDYDLAMK